MAGFSLLIKPSGPDCNMGCAYCFYMRKQALFSQGRHRMSDAVLERLVRDFLSVPMPVHQFLWQGGEPTLMGLPFFEKVVALQKTYGEAGRQISNALQTNGLLLDQAWCEFLKTYQFLVGISLDGPPELHDHFRVTGQGQGTYARILQSVEQCRCHGVEFNVLILLNARNVTEPDLVFDWIVEQGFDFVQFIPCVDHDEQGQLHDFAITAEQYGAFMTRIFDRWVEFGVKRLSVRLFDSLVSYLMQGKHSCCTFNRHCDDYVVVEHQGDVFCCDFFVTPETRLGNIMDTPIESLAKSEGKRQFSRAKKAVPSNCFVCRHHAVCRGGCPSHRYSSEDGQVIHFLCEGYKQLFDHAMPRLSGIVGSLYGR